MAVLEKIRSRSAILFTIIIVALLAFILGDFLTSSRSLTGPGTTAAKVAGQKIDFQKFQQNVEQRRQQMQNQGYNDVDIAQLQNQVLEEMIFEALMNQQLEDLGIVVTDNELSQAIVGENPLPAAANYARQYGFNSPAEFYDVAHYPAKYDMQQNSAQLLQAWNDYENNINRILLQQKFAQLMQGALTANQLDAKSYYDDNTSTANVAYTRKSFSTIPDDEIELSGDDLRAIYNENKERYALREETRPIDYITVDIVPSEEDVVAGQKKVEDALIALREQPGTEGVEEDLDFVVNRSSAPRQAVAANVRNSLDSLQKDNVQVISNYSNNYTIAKLVSTFNDVDTVRYEAFAVTGNKAVQDSVVELVNGGAVIDSLIAQGLIAQHQPEQAVYVPSAGALVEFFKTTPEGKFVIPENFSNDEGAAAYKIVKRNAPVPFYDLAVITYKIDPSPATISKLRADLQAYADTANTAAKFAENANNAGYHVYSGAVTPSSLAISNVKDSRSAAKWAMNAKKGQVSKVYGDDQSGKYLVVALKDIYDSGYTPAQDPDVTRELTMRARNQKKGEKLMADYAGKASDVQGYAEIFDVKVDTTQVTFGRNDVRGFPPAQSMLIAQAASAEPGKTVGPFVIDNALVVIEVVDVEKAGREFDYDNDAMMFNQQLGAAIPIRNIYQVLLGNNKIKNNLQQFYSE